MTLYRAIHKLSGIAGRGDLTPLAHLDAEQIAKLMRIGAIAPLAAPPLAELPGWAARSAKLAKVGIQDAGQFLEGDPALLRRVLRVKAEAIERYRASLLDLLIVRENISEF